MNQTKTLIAIQKKNFQCCSHALCLLIYFQIILSVIIFFGDMWWSCEKNRSGKREISSLFLLPAPSLPVRHAARLSAQRYMAQMSWKTAQSA